MSKISYSIIEDKKQIDDFGSLLYITLKTKVKTI